MRQATATLDLERPTVIRANVALQSVTDKKLLANLHGVYVYALGVDGTGASVRYWQGLRNFWTTYFGRAGADLKRYSMLREFPELRP